MKKTIFLVSYKQWRLMSCIGALDSSSVASSDMGTRVGVPGHIAKMRQLQHTHARRPFALQHHRALWFITQVAQKRSSARSLIHFWSQKFTVTSPPKEYRPSYLPLAGHTKVCYCYPHLHVLAPTTMQLLKVHTKCGLATASPNS